MLDSARQGYDYQDILAAYLVARELADGRKSTKFHFDRKKTSDGVPDKFDDLAIYRDETTIFIQIKYSNEENRHTLTKQDFSSSANYDLALFDLFKTWKALHKPGYSWRVCLAWDKPLPDDAIYQLLIQLPDNESLLPGTLCYQFNCDLLWPENGQVLSSWRALRREANSITREEFKSFLDCLVIEVDCPKSTFLKDFSTQLEKYLAHTIEKIGIGIYPNDHLSTRQVAESLCRITNRRRITTNEFPISCEEIAQDINIIQSFGGVEQKFPIDKSVLVTTPNRIDQVISVLEEHRTVILTAEPGAGKSWFIENLQDHLEDSTRVIKHYCYVALNDPLAVKRITVNVLYGSLITQIVESDEDLNKFLPMRYASNFDQLNTLLKNIKKKTLLIIDGIDHIWRIYQKNSGGLPEDKTRIIQALSELDYSNPNVSLLIVSQPIDQLEELTTFYRCELAQLPESFVEDLLERHAIPNVEIEEVFLAQMILNKSNGNALYCKYLIDYALSNKTQTSFDWIDNLPLYDFNLESYYQYLYEQIQGDALVPQALCGADFSLTEIELQEITYLGDMVSTQLVPLKPILKYVSSLGYSIYHESFKRFVIEMIKAQGAEVNYLVYAPLIRWLETHSFFESTKAFGHLLKLYYEVDAFDEIAKTISIDFIEKSLHNAQPLHRISENHNLQKSVLQFVEDFVPIIIIAEQAKIIYQIEHNITGEVLLNYIKAIQKVHGDEKMYRVLWDGENLLVPPNDALQFLVDQAYQGNEIVHWAIIPDLVSIPYEILGLVSVKLILTKQYEKFDSLIQNIFEDPQHKKAFPEILNELEWLCLYLGDDWIEHTPYYQDILSMFRPPDLTLTQVVENIILKEKFIYNDNWEVGIRNVVELAKIATDAEVDKVIGILSKYNWFRNWLIYLIKITMLSQKEYSNKDVIDAFTYLVRDIEPFKGKPRACDLYKQLSFIKKTFHWGLLLCQGNEELLAQCCELLEKVTNLTTSLQRSYSGPLTDEEYLELIAYYMPGEYVIQKYEKYYGPLGSRRVYSDIAEVAFKYTYVLSDAGQSDEAKAKYMEGIQALTAYGYRKDRTLSEVLYCSVPYQKKYGTLGPEWFFELYHMAMTVATHTDGRSTSSYPVEWFQEFIEVYPDEALKFLISETIESSEANWYQEDEFFQILESSATLFSPTQWFLLCKSLPLASSNKILSNAFDVYDQIDFALQNTFSRWVQSRPYILKPDSKELYSQEISDQYEKKFGISLKIDKSNPSKPISHSSAAESSSLFPTTCVEDALAFLENNSFHQSHVSHLKEFLLSITDLEEKKTILRQIAKSFRYSRDAGSWVNNIFDSQSYEWLYLNICLFVYIPDGWGHGLHHVKYLKDAYSVDSKKTIALLMEILGHYLFWDSFPMSITLNLINALLELNVDETVVQGLFQLIFDVVKRRLPNPPNSEINDSIFHGLDNFNRDELVVALLIARLKTLTTEKNQGIIWSLTYIAQTAPKTIINPFIWAFSNYTYLLPIQRAVLLQILIEYVDQDMIPDELIVQLLSYYPSGFFLEDQYIRTFMDFKIELDENSASFIQFEAHQYDQGFFLIHPKYRTLVEHFGTLSGTYKAYSYKRKILSEEHRRYFLQTDRIVIPIVSNANASYEIINSQYYAYLKNLTENTYPSNICNLQFHLPEIIIQVGALSKRPPDFLTPEKFQMFEIQDSSSPFEYEEWVILASKEEEFYGETLEPKKRCIASLILTTDNQKEGGDFYAKYQFSPDLYTEENTYSAPYDKPICRLDIADTLEHSSICYVFPYAIRELRLKLDFSLHHGFIAYNEKGEEIIKIITWKEDYFGDISKGTETPRLDGTAVVIRADYYEQLLALYKNELHYVLTKQDVGDE